MSLGGRIWRVARHELRRRLGMVQGTSFGAARRGPDDADSAREELYEWLRNEEPPRARPKSEPPPGPRAKTATQSQKTQPPPPPPPRPYAQEYRLLEAPLGSDLLTVRRCWRQAVRKYHPDLFPPGSRDQQAAAARLREMNGAYERLRSYLEPGSR